MAGYFGGVGGTTRGAPKGEWVLAVLGGRRTCMAVMDALGAFVAVFMSISGPQAEPDWVCLFVES